MNQTGKGIDVCPVTSHQPFQVQTLHNTGTNGAKHDPQMMPSRSTAGRITSAGGGRILDPGNLQRAP